MRRIGTCTDGIDPITSRFRTGAFFCRNMTDIDDPQEDVSFMKVGMESGNDGIGK